MTTPRLCSRSPLAARAAPVLFLILFLSGCLTDTSVHDPPGEAFEGHRAIYRATEEPDIQDRDLTYTVLRIGDAGYLMHLRARGDGRLEQGDYVFQVDREGFIISDVQLCESRTADGSCAWGDYHSFETWGRGLPFLCGALIPEAGTYVRTDIVGRTIETSLDVSHDGEHLVAVSLQNGQRFMCKLSGSYPPEQISSDAPPPGTYRGMMLQSGDPPFEPHGRPPVVPSAFALEREPTEMLDEIPETSVMPAEEAVDALRNRSALFASFAASNPSGITPVVNVFQESGSITVGPTVGPLQREIGQEQHYERELVFFGKNTADLFRGVVQGSQLRAGGENVSLPRHAWVVTEEEPSADGYQAWSPLTDRDGEILSPRFQLTHAMETAEGIGIVEGRVVAASYRPTWSEPYVSEVESMDACVRIADGRANRDTVGLVYTETVCVSTATGLITQATGDWDLIRRASGLPDLDWAELIR